MSEKRFIIAICGDGKLGIRDLTTLNEYTSERQVADYMNRITDENEQLKIDMGILKDNHEIDREIIDDLQEYVKKLEKENKELKDLLKSMADRNDEIWLDNGQIIRLKKVFKGEWTND